MKRILAHSLGLLMLLAIPAAGQTLNWGSQVFSDLRDSNGNALDGAFVFQLGAFASGFAPTADNLDQWIAHWLIFDQADYNEDVGYFTSTTQINDAGTSNSLSLSNGTSSFAGLNAYLWIRKGDEPIPGSEWLAVRAAEWIYPIPTQGCCDNDIPIEWSVSDLANEIPNWGSQNGIQGPGIYTYDGPHTLQTYTFVPEPSVILLGAFSSTLLMCRRKRPG